MVVVVVISWCGLVCTEAEWPRKVRARGRTVRTAWAARIENDEIEKGKVRKKERKWKLAVELDKAITLSWLQTKND